MKLIRAKFRSTCEVCKKGISVGMPIYWAKGLKPIHQNCYSATPSNSGNPGTPATPATATPNVPVETRKGTLGRLVTNDARYPHNFVIDWSELKPWLINAVVNGQITNLPSDKLRNYVARNLGLSGSMSAGFRGGEKSDLARWLTVGYRTDAIQGLAGLVPPIREKRKIRYAEDGDEFHYDIAMSGDENYMSHWTKRESIPGVRLSMELDASASSTGSLMEYQRWMAMAIYALESSGVDCEVEIYTLSAGLFNNQRGTARQAVRVKNEGEITDFAGFSAMLSPAAFRGIMFSTFSLHSAKETHISQRGYGRGVTYTWGVKYNKEAKQIDVSCDWSSSSFPAEKMTEQLRQAIMEMKKG